MTVTIDGTSGITYPAGTIQGTGYGPAFSAYLNSTQTLPAATITKLQIATEEFDTANCYDNATNYRFTPNVAGYYQISGSMAGTCTTTFTQILVVIYKNGTQYKYGTYIFGSLNNSQNIATVSSLVYLNGTTDYVELYGYVAGTGTLRADPGASITYFNGSMVRGA